MVAGAVAAVGLEDLVVDLVELVVELVVELAVAAEAAVAELAVQDLLSLPHLRLPEVVLKLDAYQLLALAVAVVVQLDFFAIHSSRKPADN
jgi:hypothetical protein